MRTIPSALIGLVLTCLVTAQATAAEIYKCVSDGKVSYQAAPCQSGVQTQRPTVEQLNRERRQRQEASAAPGTTPALPVPSAAPPKVTAPASPAASFRCDGRTYCSQMRSCAEAKYFLANCPGVKMDGDGDGIPCEDQWCH